MKLQINNGSLVGTAEWQAPGRVAVDVADAGERRFFESYFRAEDSFLTGAVGDAEMSSERPDSSPEAFMRAAFRLARYRYTVALGGADTREGADYP